MSQNTGVEGKQLCLYFGSRKPHVQRGIANRETNVIDFVFASGCYSLDSGLVEVFGHRTPIASKELRIPGKDIGYTPQELALHLDFRINELFYFYGVLNGMKSEHIFKQMDFIQELLHLPDGNRLIKTLSGGQKRLVSFGTAVIHDPRLMILDEPTVGVDPVISASIWQHPGLKFL